MYTAIVLLVSLSCTGVLAGILSPQPRIFKPDIGSWKLPAQSCWQIKNMNAAAPNGIYYIQDAEGSVYSTYCDMITGGGGWTLVASVHENALSGKCTSGDRWSSEQGNNPNHPHGDGNWANRATFGRPESASSDDYKNSGYFNMAARDVMIWHVPNNTPLNLYELKAFMKYHTYNGFLALYGGNLQGLFSVHFPLLDNEFNTFTDNGPAVPVQWDRGSNTMMDENTPEEMIQETEPGYIQFRAINEEKSALALCPGVKMVDNFGNAEHVCVGGTSFHNGHDNAESYCGDFAAKDWNGYATDTGKSANKAITESVIMMFYR